MFVWTGLQRVGRSDEYRDDTGEQFLQTGCAAVWAATEPSRASYETQVLFSSVKM